MEWAVCTPYRKTRQFTRIATFHGDTKTASLRKPNQPLHRMRLRRIAELSGSPLIRAERANLKSRKDGMKIAQERAPPWATIWLPLRGAGQVDRPPLRRTRVLEPTPGSWLVHVRGWGGLAPLTAIVRPKKWLL